MNYFKSSVALIVDDHALFNDSFSAMIEKLGIFNVVVSYTNEKDMLSFLMKNEHQKTYLFLDYYLKDTVALTIVNEAKRICKKIQIVFVSSVINPVLIKNILKFSPGGVISKSSGFEIVIKCIRAIEKKEQYLCPVIRAIINSDNSETSIVFTAREIEILQMFAHGHSIDKAAEILHISKHTVVAHRRNMMTKSDCRSITELLYYARKRGLI